ncbi:ABC transporter substrate-binding protein [Haladaptatus sp. ZSTT2]|uniref:ABC transporter substrate-binding protein n=1 Tax=Haladaptatus sp. ZSTT2 TaxID=3120515 RepID=UPI00300EFE28
MAPDGKPNAKQSVSNRSISRRSALRGLGAASLVGLAGCTGGSNNGDGGDGGGASGPDKITIGLQADMTGVLASYGYWHKRVLEGYVEELNANDGINGAEVELVVEDTATDSKQGVQAMRKLVQQEGADFVIGSQSSGVSIATNPLAKQLKVPYFPIGEAPSITGADGTRWTIRNNHSTNHAAILAVQYGLENLGKNWTIMYQDYAFGQQYTEWVKREVEGSGTVLTEIPVPVGTSDLNSYLNKVPDDTEVLFNALVGPSALNFLKQSADLGTSGARLGPIASVEGVDVSGLDAGADGAAYVTMLPRRLEEADNEYNRHLRDIARVDESDQVLNGGHYFVSYEALSWIKDAVTETGWSSESDNQAFIEWFETGPSVEQSNAYPQGKKMFRGTDHQAFMDMYIEEISGGKLTVAEHIEVSEPTFDAQSDLSAMSF